MANILGPFGFSHWGTASGGPNFAESHNTPYRISATWATAIFYGDLVRQWVSGDGATASAGFLIGWTAGDGATATKIPVGIFVGCEYFSTGQKKHVWSNFWPGADATGDVSAFIIDDPNALFKVQAASGVTITQANLGMTADIASTPVGNTTTGISGMSLNTPTTTSTLPFKVMNLITTPPGANGTDITTAGNYAIVSFNNQQYKALPGV